MQASMMQTWKLLRQRIHRIILGLTKKFGDVPKTVEGWDGGCGIG
jgi:hypothetical protein